MRIAGSSASCPLFRALAGLWQRSLSAHVANARERCESEAQQDHAGWLGNAGPGRSSTPGASARTQVGDERGTIEDLVVHVTYFECECMGAGCQHVLSERLQPQETMRIGECSIR